MSLRRSFNPILVNGAAGDPVLLLGIRGCRRVLLADCGDLTRLSHGLLRRVSDLLVSHGHLDHLGDFARLLRARMGEHGGEIRVWGPPPIQRQIHGLLSGFAWNLLGDFPLSFAVFEVQPGRVSGTRFVARRGGFAAAPALPGGTAAAALPADGLLHEEEGVRLRAAVLDHGIPCLAFAIEEGLHVEIDPQWLAREGLAPGPWLSRLRWAVAAQAPADTPIEPRPGERRSLAELRRAVCRVSPGRKVVWAVDLADSEANRSALATIAAGAELLYLEAPFLHAEAERARATHHLTARQAGALARWLGAKRLVPVHVSARHHQAVEQVVAEALEEFREGGEAAGRPPDA